MTTTELHADAAERARDALRPYGYAVNNTGELVHPKGTHSGVFLSTKRRDGSGRFQARTADGVLIWSGHDPAAFVRSYWYAEIRAGVGA